MAEENDSLTKITKAESQKIMAWLREKWGEAPKCPMCSSDKWSIGGHVSTAVPLIENKMQSEGPIHPCVAVICHNCGNTIFVNAKTIGITK